MKIFAYFSDMRPCFVTGTSALVEQNELAYWVLQRQLLIAASFCKKLPFAAANYDLKNWHVKPLIIIVKRRLTGGISGMFSTSSILGVVTATGCISSSSDSSAKTGNSLLSTTGGLKILASTESINDVHQVTNSVSCLMYSIIAGSWALRPFVLFESSRSETIRSHVSWKNTNIFKKVPFSNPMAE